MGDPRFDKLTDRERAILRLIPECRNSSEIGRRTGDTPTTVDKLIKSARSKLDAPDRLKAARVFLAHEAGGPALGPPTEDLPDAHRPRFPLPVRTAGRPINDLTIRERLLSIVGIAIFIALASIALLMISGTIQQTLGSTARSLAPILN